MAKGIIYIMPTAVSGLVKIGKTGTSNYPERMRALEANGYYNAAGLKRFFAIELDDSDEHLAKNFRYYCFASWLLLVRGGDTPVVEDGNDERETDSLCDVKRGRALEDIRHEPIPDGLEGKAAPKIHQNRHDDEDDEGDTRALGRPAAKIVICTYH